MEDASRSRRLGPKVGHRKSRLGCQKCKHRRVKASSTPFPFSPRTKLGIHPESPPPLTPLAWQQCLFSIRIRSAMRNGPSVEAATALASAVHGQAPRSDQGRPPLLRPRQVLNRRRAASPTAQAAPPMRPLECRRRSAPWDRHRTPRVSSFSRPSTAPLRSTSRNQDRGACWSIN